MTAGREVILPTLSSRTWTVRDLQRRDSRMDCEQYLYEQKKKQKKGSKKRTPTFISRWYLWAIYLSMSFFYHFFYHRGRWTYRWNICLRTARRCRRNVIWLSEKYCSNVASRGRVWSVMYRSCRCRSRCKSTFVISVAPDSRAAHTHTY